MSACLGKSYRVVFLNHRKLFQFWGMPRRYSETDQNNNFKLTRLWLLPVLIHHGRQ